MYPLLMNKDVSVLDDEVNCAESGGTDEQRLRDVAPEEDGKVVVARCCDGSFVGNVNLPQFKIT